MKRDNIGQALINKSKKFKKYKKMTILNQIQMAERFLFDSNVIHHWASKETQEKIENDNLFGAMKCLGGAYEMIRKNLIAKGFIKEE